MPDNIVQKGLLGKPWQRRKRAGTRCSRRWGHLVPPSLRPGRIRSEDEAAQASPRQPGDPQGLAGGRVCGSPVRLLAHRAAARPQGHADEPEKAVSALPRERAVGQAGSTSAKRTASRGSPASGPRPLLPPICPFCRKWRRVACCRPPRTRRLSDTNPKPSATGFAAVAPRQRFPACCTDCGKQVRPDWVMLADRMGGSLPFWRTRTPSRPAPTQRG